MSADQHDLAGAVADAIAALQPHGSNTHGAVAALASASVIATAIGAAAARICEAIASGSRHVQISDVERMLRQLGFEHRPTEGWDRRVEQKLEHGVVDGVDQSPMPEPESVILGDPLEEDT